jgi:predicted ATPase with chaperone activity
MKALTIEAEMLILEEISSSVFQEHSTEVQETVAKAYEKYTQRIKKQNSGIDNLFNALSLANQRLFDSLLETNQKLDLLEIQLKNLEGFKKNPQRCKSLKKQILKLTEKLAEKKEFCFMSPEITSLITFSRISYHNPLIQNFTDN